MYKIQMKINNTKEIGNKNGNDQMFQPVCEDRSQCPHLPKKRHGIDYLGQSVTGVESTCMYEINFTYNYVTV